jgi:AcrR family transcriptional regulator
MTKMKVDSARRAEIGRERRARTRARLIASAFEQFGHEEGLFTSIEQIADGAGISRVTFYNHFRGMEELREALTHEIAHGFLVAVTDAVSGLEDPAERAAAAIRFYLERGVRDSRWGWSMLNLSANGIIFGAETHRQAEQTVKEGIASGAFQLASSAIGRDLILGTTLAALATHVRSDPGPEFIPQVIEQILLGLGVPRAASREIARRPLPPLAPDAASGDIELDKT